MGRLAGLPWTLMSETSVEKPSGLHACPLAGLWRNTAWASLGQFTFRVDHGAVGLGEAPLQISLFLSTGGCFVSLKAGLLMLTLILVKWCMGRVLLTGEKISMRSFCSYLGGKAFFLTQADTGFCTTIVTINYWLAHFLIEAPTSYHISGVSNSHQQLRFLSQWTNVLISSSLR